MNVPRRKFITLLGGAAQAQATQLLNHSDGLLACCRNVLAGVDPLMALTRRAVRRRRPPTTFIGSPTRMALACASRLALRF
jgi:hypothetical protein